jgi:hypothetical protein
VVIGVLPGFCADAALVTSDRQYRSRALHGQRLNPPRIAPAGVHVSTGHCGCYADQWFGLPCICVEITRDPPPIVPVPAWEYL